MSRNIRSAARTLVSKLILAHEMEYMAAGVPARSIRVKKIGFEAFCLVDDIAMWKITVKNEAVAGQKDHVWVEDEYIGPAFKCEGKDPALIGLFLPRHQSGIACHY